VYRHDVMMFGPRTEGGKTLIKGTWGQSEDLARTNKGGKKELKKGYVANEG